MCFVDIEIPSSDFGIITCVKSTAGAASDRDDDEEEIEIEEIQVEGQDPLQTDGFDEFYTCNECDEAEDEDEEEEEDVEVDVKLYPVVYDDEDVELLKLYEEEVEEEVMEREKYNVNGDDAGGADTVEGEMNDCEEAKTETGDFRPQR